jgi:hypothetical protein
MKKLLALIALFTFPVAGAQPCEKPWLFFDLGENTLVYTDGRSPEGDLIDMHYMEGANEYLHDLADKGYPVNLIVNIPGEWGVRGLISYIDRPGGWTEGAARFDWKVFKSITVPITDDLRKPQHSDLPYAASELWLYQQAMAKVPAGCPALLQTGIKEEVLAAESVGMAAWVHPKTKGPMALIPEADIERFIKDQEKHVRNTRETQAKWERYYASRGWTIPRRKSADSTE